MRLWPRWPPASSSTSETLKLSLLSAPTSHACCVHGSPHQPKMRMITLNNVTVPPIALAHLDQARALLAECRTADEVRHIHDKAEAMRVYAQQAKLGLEAQNHA